MLDYHSTKYIIIFTMRKSAICFKKGASIALFFIIMFVLIIFLNKTHTTKLISINNSFSYIHSLDSLINKDDIPKCFMFYYKNTFIGSDALNINYQQNHVVQFSLNDSLQQRNDSVITILYSYQAKWSKNTLCFYHQKGYVKVVIKEGLLGSNQDLDRRFLNEITDKLKCDFIIDFNKNMTSRASN